MRRSYDSSPYLRAIGKPWIRADLNTWLLQRVSQSAEHSLWVAPVLMLNHPGSSFYPYFHALDEKKKENRLNWVIQDSQPLTWIDIIYSLGNMVQYCKRSGFPAQLPSPLLSACLKHLFQYSTQCGVRKTRTSWTYIPGLVTRCSAVCAVWGKADGWSKAPRTSSVSSLPDSLLQQCPGALALASQTPIKMLLSTMDAVVASWQWKGLLPQSRWCSNGVNLKHRLLACWSHELSEELIHHSCRQLWDCVSKERKILSFI